MIFKKKILNAAICAFVFSFVSMISVSCASVKFEDKAYLTGRVCDMNGNPVPNYFVSAGLGLQTVTDMNGMFCFPDAKSSSYTLSGGGFGWCPFEKKFDFYDRKSIVCVQVDSLDGLFPKIEALLQESRFSEVKKILSDVKDHNEKNGLFLCYKALTDYCMNPTEKKKSVFLKTLEKI